MENKLERKYGLFTAICLVVGIVIGSGVFFKAQMILQKAEGSLFVGILAWLIGGMIMLACILTFSAMAQKYEKVNGVVDYAEVMLGKRYAYYIGWFLSTTYYPTLTSVLAWLSARYTLVFITSCWPDFPLLIPASQGGCAVGPECMALTTLYLCASYAMNALSPKMAGKFQTSTTIIKLIPLGMMAVVGTLAGLFSPTHMLVSNFTLGGFTLTGKADALFASVCATAFAYEGWIVATSINAELKDAKKNLPRALIIGALIIILVYIAYFVGVAGGATVDTLMHDGATTAFTNVFGGVLGNILNLFVAVSCLGTTNGLMLGCSRGLYSLAVRKQGPSPEKFAEVGKTTNMAGNSAVAALMFCAGWGLYFYLTNVAKMWTGTFAFDSSEIPVITLYAFYIPIFVMWMVKQKDEKPLRRFVLPTLAILGSVFMVFACIIGHGWANLWYLIVFAVIMVIGGLYYRKNA